MFIMNQVVYLNDRNDTKQFHNEEKRMLAIYLQKFADLF